MKKIIVLGAGRVGSAIALDLNRRFEVTSVDINEEALKKLSATSVQTVVADLSKREVIQSLVSDFDLVVGAVPGFMGFEAVKAVIEAKKDIVDISFFPEDAFELDALAKENGVTAVVDCGVAPGFGNIVLGFHHAQSAIKDFKCYVGGLPVKREWPYEYKAVFSPVDVIEEYTRPARFIQNGILVTREALSDAEFIDFEKVGTLEAWNSDGLRTILKTMDIPNMIEKTLRYPGTIQYLRVLRETGFFSYDEIDINGKKIRPIDVTAKLLFPKWKLKPGDKDFTVMKIIIELENEQKIIYDFYDEFDVATNTISMARTTGYTCNAVVNLVAQGVYTRKGISPPEYIGENRENYLFVLKYLKERGIEIDMRVEGEK